MPVTDLRDLFPPEPLVHILAALEGGGPGPFVFLLAIEPRPLYGLLERGGWRHATRRIDRGVELTVERNP